LLLLSESVLDSLLFISVITVSTLPFDVGQYLEFIKKKFFIKNFNIHKNISFEIHGKDGILENLWFNLELLFFFYNNKVTPFWIVVFNHFGSFGNTIIKFISTTGTNYPSETYAKFRILKVEL